MERVIKGFWLVTLLLVFVMLMYVFASLPEMVYYSEVDSIDHNTFFYIALGMISFVNFPLYGLSLKFKKDQALAKAVYGWLYTLGTFLNAFLFIALQYINLFNSGEKVNYSYYGYFLYICLALLVGCILALPIIIMKNIKK
jgi:hypothetical protein